MTENREPTEKWKESTEKIWDATRKTFQTAGFHANRYKKIVQKKIDIASLHKKISAAHGDLGKLIDDSRGTTEENILNKDEVQDLFTRLDELKQAAANLEAEVEAIKAEHSTSEEKTQEKDL
jgi:uncharacterized membrane protein